MAVNEFDLTGYYCPNKYLCTKLRLCVNFRSRSLFTAHHLPGRMGWGDLDSGGILAVTVLRAQSFYVQTGSGGWIFSYGWVATRILRWLGKLGLVGDELRVVPVVSVALLLLCPVLGSLFSMSFE